MARSDMAGMTAEDRTYFEGKFSEVFKRLGKMEVLAAEGRAEVHALKEAVKTRSSVVDKAILSLEARTDKTEEQGSTRLFTILMALLASVLTALGMQFGGK